MSASALGVVAARAAVTGATLVGKSLLTRRQRERIASEAANVLVGGDTSRFVEALTPPQVQRLQDFVESAQFSHLVQQAMILVLAKFTEGLRWAHLDIAGVAYVGGAQKGSPGRPVPLLVDYLLNQQ